MEGNGGEATANGATALKKEPGSMHEQCHPFEASPGDPSLDPLAPTALDTMTSSGDHITTMATIMTTTMTTTMTSSGGDTTLSHSQPLDLPSGLLLDASHHAPDHPRHKLAATSVASPGTTSRQSRTHSVSEFGVPGGMPPHPTGASGHAAANRRFSISIIPTPFDRESTSKIDWEVDAVLPADHPRKQRRKSSQSLHSHHKDPSTAIARRMSSGVEKWHAAVHAVSVMKGVANQFHTLRDMQNSSEVPRHAIKVISVLGKGAFAIVEKCIYRPSGGKPVMVAVKRLKPELTKNEADIKDMVQEVALLRKLANRHIVAFHGYGHWDFSTSASTRQGSLFIVEELVDGGSLKTIVTKQMRDDQARHYRSIDALRWLRQIALGLAYLHRSQPQVIHRDLKLENILVKGADTVSCEVKIADFGLSALVRGSSVGRRIEQEMHTATVVKPARARRASATDLDNVWMQAAAARQQHGKLPPQPGGPGRSSSMAAKEASAAANKLPPQPKIKRESNPPDGVKLSVASGYDQLSGRTGTLMYMAPEVYRQEKYNEKCDVYSWSILAYELLHRYTMISATDGSLEECQAYARRVARGFRPPITSKMPAELSSLLKSCWDQQPEERPSMEQVAAKLTELEKSLDCEAFDKAFLDFHMAAAAQRKSSASSGCCVIS